MRKSVNRWFLLGGSLNIVMMGLLIMLQAMPVAATPEDTEPLINEFVFAIEGVDAYEYVEIWGDTNTDYSSYSIVAIEGDNSTSGSEQRGIIDRVYNLATTNSQGYWTTGYLPGGTLENGTVTLLLVRDFTGSQGDDLDTDDDGILDAAPWTAVVDDIAVHDGGANDWAYGTVTLTVGFDGYADHPGGASRIPDHIDTDSVGDWARNDYDGEGLPGFVGTPEIDEALNTPGRENMLPSAAELVINEIDYDQPGLDTAEFIEIKNNSMTVVNLYIYRIELVRHNGMAYGSFSLPRLHLAPGDYFVACSGAEANTVPNCDHQFSSEIQNAVNTPNAVALWFGDVITPVDTVSYEGDVVSPYTEGAGVDPGDDDPGQDGISRIPDGLDTQNNDEDFRQRCLTPGFANSTLVSNCESLLEPSFIMSLTAVPVSVTEPGGNVTFSLKLTNTGNVSLTVTTLSESAIGGLDGEGNCLLPAIVPVDGGYSCDYSDFVGGSVGEILRSVTAVAEDKNGNEAESLAQVTITITEDIDPGPDDQLVFLPVVVKPLTFAEPNNDCGSAYAINLNQTYHFFAEDSYDWYEFTLNSSSSVQIELTNFVPAAGQLLVYSGNCNTLTQEAHNGALAADNVMNLGTLSAGTYYIWLINDGAFNSTDLYSISVQAP